MRRDVRVSKGHIQVANGFRTHDHVATTIVGHIEVAYWMLHAGTNVLMDKDCLTARSEVPLSYRPWKQDHLFPQAQSVELISFRNCARTCVLPLFNVFSVQTGEWSVLFKVWQFPATRGLSFCLNFPFFCGQFSTRSVTASCWPRENLMIRLHQGWLLLRVLFTQSFGSFSLPVGALLNVSRTVARGFDVK